MLLVLVSWVFTELVPLITPEITFSARALQKMSVNNCNEMRRNEASPYLTTSDVEEVAGFTRGMFGRLHIAQPGPRGT